MFAAARPRAALLFIHGGYWRALDKSLHSFVAGPLVDRGVSVAVMNYDLCPAVGVPHIVEECREAVAWLGRHGANYGMPVERLVVAGHSAGGHLVAMLFATDWDRYGISPDLVVGGVAISGVFDLEPLVQVSFNTDLRLDAADRPRRQPYPHGFRVGRSIATGRWRAGDRRIQTPDADALGWMAGKPPAGGCRSDDHSRTDTISASSATWRIPKVSCPRVSPRCFRGESGPLFAG